MVVSELKGEKIDIIPFNDEPGRFIAKALSPAQVREVFIDDELRQATVIVPDEDLTKAIGREGQNVRLAARLTGWRIDIKKASDALAQAAAPTGDVEEGEEEPIGDGRCSAVLTSGRRCPNASLPGSIFCGLPMHQALVRFGAVEVALLEDLPEDELDALADPDKSQEDVQDIVTRAEEAYAERVAAEGPVEQVDDAGEPLAVEDQVVGEIGDDEALPIEDGAVDEVDPADVGEEIAQDTEAAVLDGDPEETVATDGPQDTEDVPSP
jgi:N utilization substance protein A